MSNSLNFVCLKLFLGYDDQEYSVLQESKVTGFDPSNQDYSHLELNGTTVHCTPNPRLTHKKTTDKRGMWHRLADRTK